MPEATAVKLMLHFNDFIQNFDIPYIYFSRKFSAGYAHMNASFLAKSQMHQMEA